MHADEKVQEQEGHLSDERMRIHNSQFTIHDAQCMMKLLYDCVFNITFNDCGCFPETHNVVRLPAGLALPKRLREGEVGRGSARRLRQHRLRVASGACAKALRRRRTEQGLMK